MSNPLKAIGHGLETVGKDIVIGVEDIAHVGEDVFRVLTDAKSLAPAFKTELAQLITDGEPIAAALTPAIAAGGENVALDLAAVAPVLADLKTFVAHFVSFLPTLKQAVADLEADVK
jgi:hypothetical protein